MARTYHEPEEVVRYRRRVGRGAIMKPSTHERIVRKTMARYGFPRARAEKIAGAAYWQAAESKARRARARRRRARHLHSR